MNIACVEFDKKWSVPEIKKYMRGSGYLPKTYRLIKPGKGQKKAVLIDDCDKHEMYRLRDVRGGMNVLLTKNTSGKGVFGGEVVMDNIEKANEILEYIPAYTQASTIPYAIASMAKHGVKDGLKKAATRTISGYTRGITGIKKLLGKGEGDNNDDTDDDDDNDDDNDDELMRNLQNMNLL